MNRVVTEKEKFRHELKYICHEAELEVIERKLLCVMKPDSHADENGEYLIRSVYFDNADNKALSEKVIGASRREKFRIRYYNDDLSFVTLEKKQKINDLCKKIDCALTRDELCDILSGDIDFMKDHPEQLVRELYACMKTQSLCPKVLVSYKREPYIYSPGNVRITFDSNIRTSSFLRNGLENIQDLPATDDANMMIMEVKYDDFLPDIIKTIVNEGNIVQQSFSKYEACRRFG